MLQNNHRECSDLNLFNINPNQDSDSHKQAKKKDLNNFKKPKIRFLTTSYESHFKTFQQKMFMYQCLINFLKLGG